MMPDKPEVNESGRKLDSLESGTLPSNPPAPPPEPPAAYATPPVPNIPDTTPAI